MLCSAWLNFPLRVRTISEAHPVFLPRTVPFCRFHRQTKVVNSPVMSTSPYRAHSGRQYASDEEIPTVAAEDVSAEPAFDQMSWAETRDVQGVADEGGRQVLG